MLIPPLRALAPTVKMTTSSIQMSKNDFTHLVATLVETRVDEAWYLKTYPDVAEAIRNRQVKSARAHYISSGYFENRLPEDPKLDEAWYLRTNPDVAKAVAAGERKSALQHYLDGGYAEGRVPHPMRLPPPK